MAVIRTARAGEAELLRIIERLAGERFADVGMADIADAEPMAAALLVAYAEAGRCWVATEGADRPVGFVVVDVVDDCAHIAQISVEPAHQGRGLARALIRAVERWAIEESMGALTLRTFDHVAWNRPLYEHLGFRVIGEEEIGPGLREVRSAEDAQGLDPEHPGLDAARGPPRRGRRGRVLRPGLRTAARTAQPYPRDHQHGGPRHRVVRARRDVGPARWVAS